ncbi:hypothetical protein DXG03_008463 [Asterophora parasitica]|uniref:PEHE domain-containing protein n=1 Tax=Asterophora parasitica TaxID=117018 RepID=A0A9P7GI65_9AGAR|nr:hypothetical protein DXG03_008463 [Asterophora parasitica]
MPPPSDHASLHLEVQLEPFFVFKIRHDEPIPSWVLRELVGNTGGFYSVTRTKEEISIVGESHLGIPEEVKLLSTWTCIKIMGPMEHDVLDLTGVMADFTAPLKSAKVPIFAVSTWNTDYSFFHFRLNAALEAFMMDTPISSTPGAQRQKRVLPSRSRRGGPGVGNCDADVMILDTQRRKFENEPLIPAETPFLLTTNPAVASTSSSAFEINIHANDRYFERPDVLKAYREQLIIQTPEFMSLGDTPAGRLRARSQTGQINENGPIETSDDVYEKRHRKYETFEKRQRLREKEKLKHEQYKLKERIDQLRTMDASAFLTLDDDLFPAPLDHTEAETDQDEETSFHLGPNNIEGERRRKEMLSVAHSLEERYRTLLPPDRMKRMMGGLASTDTSVEPEAPVYAGRYRRLPESEQQDPIVETIRQETERLKLKIKVPIQSPIPAVSTSAAKSAPLKKRRQSVPPARQSPVRKSKAVQEEPHIRAASPISVMDAPPTSPQAALPITSYVPSPHEEAPSSPPALPLCDRQLAVDLHALDNQHTADDQPPVSRPTTPMSNPGIAVLEPGSPEAEMVHEEAQVSVSTNHPESISAPRPRKRVKRSPLPPSTPTQRATRENSLPPIESISAPYRAPSHASTVQSTKLVSHAGGSRRNPPCLLMMQAIRSSEVGGRKGKRQTLPFGGKVPPELDSKHIVDFELPEWMDPPRGTGGPDYPDFYAEKIPGARTILSPVDWYKQGHHHSMTDMPPSA